MLISYELIGKRIKKRRMFLGLSQLDLSVDANVSAAYLCSVERGNKQVSLEILIRIANALDTTPDVLLADCLQYHIGASSIELTRLLSDCTLYESRVILDAIVGIKFSGNMGVIVTKSGYANAIAVIVDGRKSPEILGTVAGDNTIIMVLREGTTHAAVLNALRNAFPSLGNL